MRAAPVKVGLVALAASLAGCAAPRLGHAVRAAEEARYPAALRELGALEVRLHHRGPRWCARYALERGLAHLAVGDLVAADLWLRRAWAWVETRPELFTPSEQSRLAAAWRSTGRMPGER
jgi:hypothetical protein